MAASNTLENDLLAFIFNNTSFDVFDQTVSATGSPGNIYVRLFTSSTGLETDDLDNDSDEANYTNYSPVSTARSSSDWTVSGNSVTNASAITFPRATGGSSIITHVALCSTDGDIGGSTTVDVLFWGILDSSLTVSDDVIPEFPAGSLTITLD